LIVEKDVLTIEEFCERNSMSHSFYYALRQEGKGPQELRIGTGRHPFVRITLEAEAKWRRRFERPRLPSWPEFLRLAKDPEFLRQLSEHGRGYKPIWNVWLERTEN
jgi:hypothetical protein